MVRPQYRHIQRAKHQLGPVVRIEERPRQRCVVQHERQHKAAVESSPLVRWPRLRHAAIALGHVLVGRPFVPRVVPVSAIRSDPPHLPDPFFAPDLVADADGFADLERMVGARRVVTHLHHIGRDRAVHDLRSPRRVHPPVHADQHLTHRHRIALHPLHQRPQRAKVRGHRRGGRRAYRMGDDRIAVVQCRHRRACSQQRVSRQVGLADDV